MTLLSPSGEKWERVEATMKTMRAEGLQPRPHVFYTLVCAYGRLGRLEQVGARSIVMDENAKARF
jgi:hypothetical protein